MKIERTSGFKMYVDPNVDVLSLHEINDRVMKEIGVSESMTDILHLDEAIHLPPADTERYKNQLAYLNQSQQSILTAMQFFR